MQFKDSTKYHLSKKTLQLKEGTFYIADTFVIGEIHEGVHFNWDVAERIIEEVYKHFGSRDINISYISNRINNYSISPVDWYKFFVNKHKLKSISIISYSPSSLAFFFLEKFFIKTTLHSFSSLEQAIDSVLGTKKDPYDTHNTSQTKQNTTSTEL